MGRNKMKVVFADQKLEADFWRLAQAMHPEDTALYSVLRGIRKTVQIRYRAGRRVWDLEKIDLFSGLYRLIEFWSLEMTHVGTVLFSIVDQEIRIVDIV
jgi:hypothetical protein